MNNERLFTALAHLAAAQSELLLLEAETVAAREPEVRRVVDLTEAAIGTVRSLLTPQHQGMLAVVCSKCDGQGYLHDNIPVTALDEVHRVTLGPDGVGIVPCERCQRCPDCGHAGCGPGVALREVGT